ncbi:hypothetical protein NEOLEDRAFT_1176617 [Neolentinus lepideus HHB14362 ss-1]|uniref:UBC core domain-containing protein n=1 Tax=Neolentinus lepideus HHB14362 ss-1 TaxID=1314782 RepID=A0A165U402_9AGAM|nr:hypothetical protein NEOLEDRAFT_1176617 [Neolentinus lepideus HHB14362 ss-1]
MPSRKRSVSGAEPLEPASKRARKEKPPVPEQDDDLESILLLIKQQEESEALARKLHEEWNNEGRHSASGSSDASSSQSKPERTIPDDNAPAEELPQPLGNSDKLDGSPSFSRTLLSSHYPRTSFSHVASSVGVEEASESQLDLPPDVLLSEHRSLFVGSRVCTKCSAQIPSPIGNVSFSTTIPPPSLFPLLHAACTSCKTNYCRGCLKPTNCPPRCKGKDKNQTCPVSTCCAEVRAISLFETLSAFDQLYLNERYNSDKRAKAAAASRQSRVASIGPGGTGYSMGRDSYAEPLRGLGKGSSSSIATSLSKSASMEKHWEELCTRFLLTVTELLPSPYSDSEAIYDLIPHQSIRSLLFLSRLPDLLADLLRNDSVSDWTDRVEVYSAMLGLLRRLADCELTVGVLFHHRWERKKTSCGLSGWMWQDGEIEWEREIQKSIGRSDSTSGNANSPIVQAPPLYDYFDRLSKQCQTFLTGASQLMEHENGDDTVETTVKAMSLCGDIIAAKDDIERAMGVLGKRPSNISVPKLSASSKKLDAKDMEKEYAAACERLAFQHIALGHEIGGVLRYPDFNYAGQLQQTSNSTRSPKDRLHLVKELAVMATSLPPGIWVRVDEVRNDAIKIMIAGPEKTPYEGGLFEFDCFMPLEYPHKPPLVHLRTTGGGRVRFNPNLYAQGKVCLSLLGTWPGRPEEQWSAKSTLLQVLVSIQSMIMVDTPFFNEPGFGKANAKDSRSIQYNRNVALQTTKWAIVDWMNEEHRHGIWADVIVQHFTIRHSKIRKCIRDWANQDSRFQAYDLFSTQLCGGHLPPSTSHLSQGPALESGPRIDLLAKYDEGVARLQTWLT